MQMVLRPLHLDSLQRAERKAPVKPVAPVDLAAEVVDGLVTISLDLAVPTAPMAVVAGKLMEAPVARVKAKQPGNSVKTPVHSTRVAAVAVVVPEIVDTVSMLPVAPVVAVTEAELATTQKMAMQTPAAVVAEEAMAVRPSVPVAPALW